jgi:nitrous oxide reductase accessory protein NosL
MKAYAVVFAALLAAGCSTAAPLPITAADVCYSCRRTIDDPALAGEVITKTNQALKFRTTGCMVGWLKEHPDVAKVVYVTDYTSGRIIKATTATFVPFVMVEKYKKTPDYIAYYAEENATAAAAQYKSTPIRWKEVMERAAP